ncbi:MAG: circularly permuted type 2 ATP-grasp protein [Pseudomonadota bacterium]
MDDKKTPKAEKTITDKPIQPISNLNSSITATIKNNSTGTAVNVSANSSIESFLSHYLQNSPMHDEMWSQDLNAVKPHWQRLMQDLSALGATELIKSRKELLRLLRQNGVTYNVFGDPEGYQRTWQIDPIPWVIEESDWNPISEGLKQRAVLLNIILQDLYGEQRLISDGLIPPTLIYPHRGFLRSCCQLKNEVHRQLMFYTTDLARGPDGTMWVIGDRAQAPIGPGYVLEARMAMTRVLGKAFRNTQVQRLANFFRNFRKSLATSAPNGKEDPLVVLLTPGPSSGTYFEHAYLAAYLGYTLVQAEDLTVRDNKVWLKSIEGLKQIDIILRWVDDLACDPLELDERSMVGLPGLMQAVRAGQVSMSNPIGVGIIESPGLNAFLPTLCEKILGEKLLLPSAASWWCGQKKEMNYVLENLNHLVIKTIDRRIPTFYGALLTNDELATWKKRIQAEPYLYVGQERLATSTVPTLIQEHQTIEPRSAMLRCFITAHHDSFDIMPGGLTQVSKQMDEPLISSYTGARSKDTWILTDKPSRQNSLWASSVKQTQSTIMESTLSSRAAENLFWVGRYTERAEGITRLLRTVINKLTDYDDYQDESDLFCLHQLLRSLTQLTQRLPGFIEEGSEKLLADPWPELKNIVIDRQHPGSLISILSILMRSAYNVRDMWSIDTWRVLDDIKEDIKSLDRQSSDVQHLQSELESLTVTLMAFSGQALESMPQEASWFLLDLGKRLERAHQIIAMTEMCFVARRPEVVDHLLMESILSNNESLMTYRRRFRTLQTNHTILDILLLDDSHPRSLAYQVEKIFDLIKKLPDASNSKNKQRISETERLILKISTDIKLTDVTNLVRISDETHKREQLSRLLKNTQTALEKISNLITQKYFNHTENSRQLAPTQIDFNI